MFKIYPPIIIYLTILFIFFAIFKTLQKLFRSPRSKLLTLIVAHPDADDAFRFYGLLSGKICAKTSWLTQDFEVGKLALFFGANDFGRTIIEDYCSGEGA
jgi:hypothetical protein